MVCSRCKIAVKTVFENVGLHLVNVELGEVELDKQPSTDQLKQLDISLKQLGFELIDDRRSRIIEKIKNIIVEIVHHSNDSLNTNLSAFLSEKLHYDYNYLSNLFSETEGMTIEKYFIAKKIEKAKEILSTSNASVAEIAYQLGFEHPQSFSRLFKAKTNLSPQEFRASFN